MKCIRNKKTGDIIRVEDRTADSMVGITWEFVSKDTWREAQGIVRTPKETNEKVASKKQLKKNKSEKV